jgi:hypothetical protein
MTLKKPSLLNLIKDPLTYKKFNLKLNKKNNKNSNLIMPIINHPPPSKNPQISNSMLPPSFEKKKISKKKSKKMNKKSK